jgi:hypothetical protein
VTCSRVFTFTFTHFMTTESLELTKLD